MLILTLDGFSPAALSCYGSSWNATPSIDRVAVSGTTWDRVVTPTTDAPTMLARWLSRLTIPTDEIALITDDPRWADAPAAGPLGEVHLLDNPAAAIADEIEDTSLARLVAVAMSLTDHHAVTWVHSRFLSHHWDAPRWLMDDSDESGLDDSTDSMESAQIDLATGLATGLATAHPPSITLAAGDDPDQVLHWMRAYGCQVRLIDALVGIVSGLGDGDREPNTGPIRAMMIAGTTGFSLGQNHQFRHLSEPIASPSLHVPMIASPGTGIRQTSLTTLDQFADFIQSCHDDPDRPLISPNEWASTDSAPVIVSRHQDRPVAITTPSWFYQQSGGLFWKPDDVNDINDISRLKRDESDELRARLDAADV